VTPWTKARTLLAGTVGRFAIAGAVGFAVDASVLHCLSIWLGVAPMLGRVFSFLCASFVTWQLNRRYAFSPTKRRASFAEWLRYLWASAIGASVNYAVFSLLVLASAAFASFPTLAVAAGSLAGMTVNFALYKSMVFRSHNAPL